ADRDDLVDVQMKRGYRAAYEARLPAILREPRRAEVWRPLRGDFTFHAAAPAGVGGQRHIDEGHHYIDGNLLVVRRIHSIPLCRARRYPAPCASGQPST
ncbi:MAG TPA: hypothetical protein VFY87_08680, partial [Geminicoccaceae bacterium]|nr:hypothetical protein [Geminicoccaceae bacterium]